MIETLRLVNYKRHEDTELKLSPFTVLVGPNGVGKTSVLEAIQRLSSVEEDLELDEYNHGKEPRYARRATAVHLVSIRAVGFTEQHIPRQFGLTFEKGPDGTGGYSWAEGIINADLGHGLVSTQFSGGFIGEPKRKWPELFSTALLRLSPSELVASTVASEHMAIESDGRPLATVIANRTLAEDESLKDAYQTLKTLVPEFRRVRVRPTHVGTGSRELPGYSLVFDTDSGTEIPASDMSEGTLLLLAILTVVYSPHRPNILLLDGIENGLHPMAQMALTKLLRQLVEREKNLQIIATTHSPYVVDVVDPSSVVVFAKGPEGRTGCRLLSEHPEAERFHGRLSTGQLWTLDDEDKWVFEGRSK